LPHRLPRPPLRPGLAAAGAVRPVAVHRPAQPLVRELARPAPWFFPTTLDDARLRGAVGVLGRRQRLRVVHRLPRLPGRPRRLCRKRSAGRSQGL